MSNKKKKTNAAIENQEPRTPTNSEFSVRKIKNKKSIWDTMYSDEASRKRLSDRTPDVGSSLPTTAEGVRSALEDALSNPKDAAKASKKLYAINTLYSSIINYLSNMYMWRYKVTPHRSYTKSKVKSSKVISEQDFQQDYRLMLEAVDGLSVETKFPSLLSQLFIEGAVYFTTVYDEEQVLIDTLLLPNDRCRKVGETQYGTNIIQFDMQYFDSLGLTNEELKDYLATFPSEIQKGYKKYKKESSLR